MTADLARIDATAQAELVRNREASPLELVEAAIARAEAVDPELNSIIHAFYGQACEAAADGVPEGPFRGVPFLLKDLGAALAGQPLHLGMQALKDAGFRAPVDSYLARRFHAAGLVTIGKTNVPELGIQPTTEPKAYGPTRNPWDLTRSVGGSSGGAAAAVAAGIVPIAHASDGGGSIRIPASACGLVGLKPTRQRTTQGPLVGDSMSGMVVELALARSVRDAAAILDAVHGAAPGDPYVAPAPRRAYGDELETDPGSLQIGFVVDPAVESIESDPECAAAVRAAAALLGSLGHEITESDPTGGAAASGVDIPGTFLTRWAAGQATILDRLSLALGREISASEVEPLTWALAEIGRARSAGEYLSAVDVHQMMTRAVATWHDSGFDLLLTPTMAEPPVSLGTLDDSTGDPLDAFRRAEPQGVFTAIANVTGQPAISLPLHWTADGLPIGVQLIAPYGREDLLIRVAAQLERERPWAGRTPPVFAGRDT
ncbi:MAG TPA: amidase [Solirubrobacterales bacterium]|nr:amidase [Solirubrobacterales bacterium]